MSDTAGGGWRMPAETDRQARTWMAWPTPGYSLGEKPDEARRAWAAVANTIVEHGGQPVTMLVTESEKEHAKQLLRGADLLELEHDDGWARDTGPTFVVNTATRRLGAVDFVFNGWGAQDWARWAWDARVATAIAGRVGAEIIPSEMVAEGGGFHTDGQGTFLVTETVMLDPYRNLGWTRERVEESFSRAFGDCTLIWLPRGLTRDYERYGTRGHVDMLATFAAPGQVLVHSQSAPEHPDHEVSRRAVEILKKATDAQGRSLKVTEVPAPKTLRDGCGEWLDWSYINHVVCNDAIVACNFGDANDAAANGMLEAAYGREVVAVDARPLFERGGGAHCITQQQPQLPPA
ncbi:agmatine/peptidylarginine deiminase [Kitasatospora sp. NPDC056651]|uniref:agmatine deiminase family protein n=1 Tax=Kitasatospora sp. NPDC056651 TaxID=3345892 RepID=UPI0036BFB37D